MVYTTYRIGAGCALWLIGSLIARAASPAKTGLAGCASTGSRWASRRLLGCWSTLGRQRSKMHEPKPLKDGLRRYGKWAGNPSGNREDTSRCIVSVTPNERSPIQHQCYNKRGHGPNGLYCKTHDPEVVALREKNVAARREEAWNRETRPLRQREAYRRALEKIAEGHNDPRALAVEALKVE